MVSKVRRLWATSAIGALIAVTSVVSTSADSAEALSGADFNAGLIISDERFFDNNSMTESNIQQFLSARVPRCQSVDQNLPCLPNLVTSTSDRAASANGCAGYLSEGWESAAHILFKVAQTCRINAQVLIVMLQKEQGLVTATRPTARQYSAAMGANCPDTAACSPTTLGFFNQVYKAAWQMRQYTYNPSAWRHRVGNINVAYAPNAECGSSAVDIRNQATANLYNYTPYQPNAAALTNLYGAGDACSSYGNRNFWRFFSDWFGPTTARGTTQIDTVHNQMGGTTGVLGSPSSDYISISTAAAMGTGRAYSGGSIYWSPSTGAAAVIEPFRAFYFGYGGATGGLGWPNSQSSAIGTKPGGAGQSFLYGSVYTSDATGIHSVIGATRDMYFDTGGALGWLGWPTTESEPASGSGITGTLQSFEGGQIAANNSTGKFAITAPVAARYAADGGPGSSIGWPISPAYNYGENGGGSGQVFQGASIFASSAGAYTVSGVIRDVYFSARGAAGSMGWPASQVIRIAENGGGFGQAFQNASIYSSPAGSFAVAEPLRAAYFARGGASGALGWPTAAMTCNAGGACAQSFQYGTLGWDPSVGFTVT